MKGGTRPLYANIGHSLAAGVTGSDTLREAIPRASVSREVTMATTPRGWRHKGLSPGAGVWVAPQ